MVAIGLSDDAIAHRVKTGRLHRVHRGVFAVGRAPVGPLEHAAAAVLASGPHAVLSHGAALALWGLRDWRLPYHVTVTQGDPHPKGIIVHRSRSLARRDITTTFAIRVTSPARTLLDCAPTLPAKAVRRAVNEARLAHILTPAALADVVDRNPLHPGAKALDQTHRGGPTRSEFEDLFGRVCRDYDLPTPEFNVPLDGYEVDAYFPAQDLIVELDGWDFHQTREAFETDRERDAHHLEAGRRTVRVTHERLVQRPGPEARRIRKILSA